MCEAAAVATAAVVAVLSTIAIGRNWRIEDLVTELGQEGHVEDYPLRLAGVLRHHLEG